MQQSYSPTNVNLPARVAAMPKAEIHVHLEGATTAQTYFELAQRNGVALALHDLPQWQRFFEFRDFDHFIEVYVASTRCLRTANDYAFLVERFGAQQAARNVRYTEAFVSCSLMSQSIDSVSLLNALDRSARAVEREHGIRVAFIADISRELPQSQHRVVDLAIEGFKRGIFIGLGLGGPEIGFPPELFAEAYARARAAGLHVVAHAGETGGPSSVAGALDALRAERIGHGVRSLEDPQLVERLRAEGIPLEICPMSNYRLGVAKSGRPHPIRTLLDAGVRCTVNTDDPAMFETNIDGEYVLLAGQGFSWDELWALNRATLDATFLSDADKRALNEEWTRFEHSL